jgi:hypothetical protein
MTACLARLVSLFIKDSNLVELQYRAELATWTHPGLTGCGPCRHGPLREILARVCINELMRLIRTYVATSYTKCSVNTAVGVTINL